MEEIVEAAKRGYEKHYSFSEWTLATLAQVESSSAGIDGWAKFRNAQQDFSLRSRLLGAEDFTAESQRMHIRLTECVRRVGDLNLLTPHIAASATSMARSGGGLQLMSPASASG